MTISAVGGTAAVRPSCLLAPADIRLDSNEIHVWYARLEDCSRDLPRLHAVLSPDERIRANRFHVFADRDRFIAGRGILRTLLARYLHQDAATIEFSLGRFGKPSLAGPDGGLRLHFNVSHSDAVAAYAVTQTSPVGIDVEHVREIPDLDALASRALGPADGRRLMALPPARRLEEFFAGWTRTEAVLKASGEGLCGRDGMRLCRPADWRLQPLRPAPGYVGALAYRDGRAVIRMWGAL